MTTVTMQHGGCWRIRSLVAATAVIGVLGLPAALLFGEPYPWIMMPGFPGTGGVDKQRVEHTTAVFAFSFADGSVTTIDPPVLFEDFPSSNYYTLAARFSPDQAAAERFERIPAAVLPNLHAAAGSGVPDASDLELRAWLRRQAQRLFPEPQPEAVDVYWQRVSIDAAGVRRIISSYPSAKFDL